MNTYTYRMLVAVLVLRVTAGAASADGPWEKQLEWCTRNCDALTCSREIVGLVATDPHAIFGSACPRQALISLAREAARAGQRDKAFALARTCYCHDPLAHAGVEIRPHGHGETGP